MLSEHHYKAFGKETTTRTFASGAATDPWGFGAQHGYYTDNETGYVYCTFRYYDPSVGRWLSQDPIGLGGGQQNLYAYCGGNPIMRIDPVGLCDDDDNSQNDKLKEAMKKLYPTPSDAAIAFVYAIWDVSFQQQKWAAAILEIKGRLPDGKVNTKGWMISDVHTGEGGKVAGGMGGLYDVHTHPWFKGDKFQDANGNTHIAGETFQASANKKDANGIPTSGDTVFGHTTGHYMYIGAPGGIGFWKPTQDITDTKLEFIALSPY